ncbi:MAG: (2Fe-2S)-binding protein [Acidimicrobiia bacterium]|nr:(2Fe-2S)-binding protein [Acidimicrobiia bacterium]
MNDARIAAEVASGDVVDADTLAQRCGAGSRCGGCMPALEALLEQMGVGGTSGSVTTTTFAA